MSERLSRWVVVEDSFDGSEPLVIKDVGPWDQYLTITNNAEAVVEKLIAGHTLQPSQRLLYYDTDGQLDEILIEDGKFAGFKPGPKGEEPKDEAEIYVVVADNDQTQVVAGKPFSDDGGPLVFEQYTLTADLESIKKRAAVLQQKYGKCRIARLEFLSDDEAGL